MPYIKKRVLLLVTLVLSQFFFSAFFLSNESLILESRLLYYRQQTIKQKYDSNYVHTTIANEALTISPELSSFVRQKTSRSENSVLYHELINDEMLSPRIKTITGETYSINSKILYNPFRYDLNNKYFESFRVRQEFQSVDSRIFSNDYSFTIQLESELAYHLLSLNGISTNLSYYKNNNFEIYLIFGDTTFKGVVSNIFYIEDTEPISKVLQKYNGVYNIIVPSPEMRDALKKRTHFDYINNPLRVIKEMKKMAVLDNYQFCFEDDRGQSDFLNDTMNLVIEKANFNYVKLIIYSLLFLLYLGLSIYIGRQLLKEKSLNFYSLLFLIFVSAIIYAAVLFLSKKLFAKLVFYNLSNIFSGLLTTLIFVTFSAFTFMKYYTRKKQDV